MKTSNLTWKYFVQAPAIQSAMKLWLIEYIKLENRLNFHYDLSEYHLR